MDKNKLLRILLWCEILFLAIFIILIVTHLKVVGNAATIVLDVWTKILLLADGLLLFASSIARTIIKYKSGMAKYNATVATLCVIGALLIFVVVYFFAVIW